jgi:hypothetical protein
LETSPEGYLSPASVVFPFTTARVITEYKNNQVLDQVLDSRQSLQVLVGQTVRIFSGTQSTRGV